MSSIGSDSIKNPHFALLGDVALALKTIPISAHSGASSWRDPIMLAESAMAETVLVDNQHMKAFMSLIDEIEKGVVIPLEVVAER